MNLISLYTAQATAEGGRSGGRVATANGTINARLELPTELGGDVPKVENALNPEQLFACAWAASFADAIGFVAKQHNRILREVTVTATVSLGQYEEDGFGIATEFTISLPELEKADAEKIINEARLTCPYSKAFPNTENLRIILQTSI
jgi:lipoyl-dependent peroxiredoxin